jgi:hypothetical protein
MFARVVHFSRHRRKVMKRVILLVAFVFAAGCKDEAKPTSDLKVPDVKQSGSAQGKGDMTNPKGKK